MRQHDHRVVCRARRRGARRATGSRARCRSRQGPAAPGVGAGRSRNMCRPAARRSPPASAPACATARLWARATGAGGSQPAAASSGLQRCDRPQAAHGSSAVIVGGLHHVDARPRQRRGVGGMGVGRPDSRCRRGRSAAGGGATALAPTGQRIGAPACVSRFTTVTLGPGRQGTARRAPAPGRTPSGPGGRHPCWIRRVGAITIAGEGERWGARAKDTRRGAQRTAGGRGAAAGRAGGEGQGKCRAAA